MKKKVWIIILVVVVLVILLSLIFDREGVMSFWAM